MKKIILPLICLLLFATCKKEEEITEGIQNIESKIIGDWECFAYQQYVDSGFVDVIDNQLYVILVEYGNSVKISDNYKYYTSYYNDSIPIEDESFTYRGTWELKNNTIIFTKNNESTIEVYIKNLEDNLFWIGSVNDDFEYKLKKID